MMKTQALLAATCLLCLCPAGSALAQDAEAEWWLKPRRLLQTNLREIDATMDLDRYVRDVQHFGANVVLFNIGGIVANYPTELDYHFRNTHMTGNMAATVLERLHAEGIRMIGRFDFSKINEKFAEEHPEWLYVSEKGQHVNYNGQVHTCVSGGYQQEYMFEILGEAVDRLPLDGVFFNMIGYKRNDYSGNYHGICQCESCRKRFKEYSGLDLPPTQENQSPAYRKYLEFTRMMQDRQFNRVNAFLRRKRPDLAICTYTPTGVDVIRKESNSALGRGTYHDTDKAKSTLLTAGRRQLANAAVHFMAIPYRHAAVSPYLTSRRLWQQMINGAWLDFYCIGPLGRQEDRTGLDLAGGIYRFHAENERWLLDARPAGQVGLVRRGDEEYEGILQILSENQVAFELTRLSTDELETFSLVIVPDAGGLDPKQTAALDDYVQDGGRALLTGRVPEGFASLGPVKLAETRSWDKGAYIRIRDEDKTALAQPILDKLDLVFLRGEFHIYETPQQVTGRLRLIPADMFGPPEKCYYRHVSEHPALLVHEHGRGAAACFPFAIGTHYYQQGHQGHAALLLGVIDNVLELKRRVQVTAPPLVEVNHRADSDGRFEWVSLYNHSGRRGNALHGPIPISSVEISFAPARPVQFVRSLKHNRQLAFTRQDDGRVTVAAPQLEQYDIVVFEYEAP